jgi:hypothetical protein
MFPHLYTIDIVDTSYIIVLYELVSLALQASYFGIAASSVSVMADSSSGIHGLPAGTWR